MKLGVATKLWLAIMCFVLVIVISLGFIWSQLFERYYLNNLVEKMLAEGEAMVEQYHSIQDNQHFLALVESVAQVLDSEVIISSNCQELAGCLPFDQVSKEMLITGAERQQLLAGEKVIKKGWHPRFNSQILAVVLPLFRDGMMEGAVFLYAPYTSIFATIGAVRHLIVMGGLFILGAAGLLSFFLSRGISRPLLEINKATHRISDGDFTCRVAVTSEDEIGQLAGRINHLAATLNSYTTNIKRLDKIRQDLVINVSHELRTPLTYIQGYTELLLDEKSLTQEQKQFLQTILTETMRLNRLVSSLLELSNLERGQPAGKKEMIRLEKMVAGVVEKLSQLAAEKGITLAADIPAGLPVVQADGDQLERVLWNLVDNAVRFTEPGGEVKVKVRLLVNKLRVEVKDTGWGIPPEDLPYIWERFYKVDKSRAGGKSGTGLGLAIVKSIIEDHGGTVDVISQPGEGSTFICTLSVDGNQP
jgi:signal transduction histidine kinase